MEVHHHPHVEKKSFKEYILEGIMIFIAVSMGFAAESLREHLVNKEHEHIYMSSFYADLQNDQQTLPKLITRITQQQLVPARSLPELFSKATTTTPADSIYFFLRKFIRQQGIRSFITDRTIEQIKNAGEIRLITNKQIADSLIDYYKDIGFIDYLQQTLLGYKAKLLDNLPLILKSSDYAKAIDSANNAKVASEHVYLRNTNPEHINRILIQVDDINALSFTIEKYIEEIIIKNRRIEKLIEEHYHLKNE